MARFVARPGLDTYIAQTVGQRAVDRLKNDTLDGARRRAPEAKVWLCVSPDTPVTASGVTAAARRYHVGALVRVTTASGRVFAVTPEHHVLTRRGWREAKLLQKGDDLFQVDTVEAARAPGVQNPPSPIGQVVDALMEAVPVEVWAMGVPVDFDGYIAHREVEVVAVNGGLSVDLESCLPERLKDLFLVGADVLGESAVFLPGHRGQRFRRLGSMRKRDEVFITPLLDGFGLGRETQMCSLAPASYVDLGFLQDSTDGRLGAAVAERESALYGTRAIVPDHAVDVDVVAADNFGTDALRRSRLFDGFGALEVPACRSGHVQQFPTFSQPAADGTGTNRQGCGDLPGGFAGSVTPDEVVDIQFDSYEGHVYDLSTLGGWYLADGIVIHNSARDERVRPSHVSTDRQTIPGNLRYKLPRMTYVRKGRDEHGKAINAAGGWREIDGYDLGRQPRDHDLPPEQRDSCRCQSVSLPGVVARDIFYTDTLVAGGRARADVETYFTRAAESEFGTSQDVPAKFMAGGAREAMLRLRSPRR